MKKQSKYVYVPKGNGRWSKDCCKCCFGGNGKASWSTSLCTKPKHLKSCEASERVDKKFGWYELSKPALTTPASPKAKAVKATPVEVEHLVLESTPLFGQIAFRIVKQSPEATTFALGHDPWTRTKRYDGIWICCMGNPELRRELNARLTLFIRGTDKSQNKKIITCTPAEWARVKKGVAAFNKAVTKKG